MDIISTIVNFFATISLIDVIKLFVAVVLVTAAIKITKSVLKWAFIIVAAILVVSNFM